MTLNQIKNLLIGYFENHAQVQTVLYKDDYTFNAIDGINFPAVNIQHLRGNFNALTTSDDYRILIVDLMDSNVDSIMDEIMSDMREIANDFAVWLYAQPDLFFNRNIRYNTVINDSTHIVVGVELIFTISTARSQNTCNQPSKS